MLLVSLSLFLYTQKNITKTDVFRAYRKRPVAWNQSMQLLLDDEKKTYPIPWYIITQSSGNIPRVIESSLSWNAMQILKPFSQKASFKEKKNLFWTLIFDRTTTANLQHQIRIATLENQDFLFLVCIQYLMLRLDLRPKRNTNKKAVHYLHKKIHLRCLTRFW